MTCLTTTKQKCMYAISNQNLSIGYPYNKFTSCIMTCLRRPDIIKLTGNCSFQLFTDTGSHKLEDQYADFIISPLHILKFTGVAVPLFQVVTHVIFLLSSRSFAFAISPSSLHCLVIYWYWLQIQLYNSGEKLENGLLSLQSCWDFFSLDTFPVSFK